MESSGRVILSTGPYSPSELYLRSTGTKCALFKTLYGQPSAAPCDQLDYEYLGFQHRDSNVFQHIFVPRPRGRDGPVDAPLVCLKLEDVRTWEYYDLLAEPNLVAPTDGLPTFGIYHWCELFESADATELVGQQAAGEQLPRTRWTEEEIFNRLLDFIVSRSPLSEFPALFSGKSKEQHLHFRLDGIFVFDGENAEEGIFQIVPPDELHQQQQQQKTLKAFVVQQSPAASGGDSEAPAAEAAEQRQQELAGSRLIPPILPLGSREPSPSRERLRRSLNHLVAADRLEIPQYSTLPPPSLSLDRCQGTTLAGLPCGRPTTVGASCDEHLPPGVFAPGPDGKEQYNNIAPLPSGWIPTRPPPNPPEGSETPRVKLTATPTTTSVAAVVATTTTTTTTAATQTPAVPKPSVSTSLPSSPPHPPLVLSSSAEPITKPSVVVAATTTTPSPSDAVFPPFAATPADQSASLASHSTSSLDDLFSDSLGRFPRPGGQVTLHESARLVRAFRPTWIFDLDDTIVYTREGGFLNEKEIVAMNLGGIEYHYIVFQVGEHTLQMTTFLRPGWLDCLLQLRKRGRIYVCTMGIQAYCDAVVGLLNRLAAARLAAELPGTASLIPLGRSAQNCGVKFLEIFSTDDVPENYRLMTEFDRQNCLIFDDRRDVWLRQQHRDDRLHVIVMKNWNPESTTVPLLDDFLADAVRIALLVVKETYRRLYQIHQRGLHPATDFIADVLLDYYTSEEKMHQVRRHLDRLGQREQERLRNFLPS